MSNHPAVRGVTIDHMGSHPSLATHDETPAVAARCGQAGSEGAACRVVGSAIAACLTGAALALLSTGACWAAAGTADQATALAEAGPSHETHAQRR